MGLAWAVAIAAGLHGVTARAQDAEGTARAPALLRVIESVARGGEVNLPMGVAVTPDGRRIFVADAGNARIQVFEPSTSPYLGSWGTRGEVRGQFWQPRDVAVSPDGRYLYVVDAGLSLVMQYRLDEKFCVVDPPSGHCDNQPLQVWGGPGKGPGLFQNPIGLAVDSRGNVYVADEGASDIEVFTPDGSLSLQILGGPGSDPHKLNHPRDVAIGPEDEVWVADTNRDRVAIFNQDGSYKRQIQSMGSRVEDKLFKPSGIAVARDGRFLIRDFEPSYATPRLWRFGADGKSLGPAMDLEGQDQRMQMHLQGAAFLPSGDAVISNPYTGPALEPEVLVTSLMLMPPDGGSFMALATRGSEPGQFDRPRAAAIDDQLVAISDQGNQRVQILDPLLGFRPVHVFGAPEIALGRPAGIALWRMGPARDQVKVYVADPDHHMVRVFLADGVELAQYGKGVRNRSPEGLDGPEGVTVDAAGILYIADTGNNRVVRYDADGRLLGNFGGTGSDALEYPHDLTIGPDGLLYVIERGQARISAYTREGALVHRWESEAPERGEVPAGRLRGASAITADATYLYLLENDNAALRRVTIFTPPAPAAPLVDAVVNTFAESEGAGPAGADRPMGLAAHRDGRILLVDSGNNRLKLYGWGGAPPSPTATATETRRPTMTPSATASDTASPPTRTATPTPSATRQPDGRTPTPPESTPTEFVPTATRLDNPTAPTRPVLTREPPFMQLYLPRNLRQRGGG